ncbi:multiple epidermal growth factor-like domains 10 [Plakobranchus ocellatus]|uniref:Multiple epidermal growth factor-like domains 10 n=1 Tax=Plakobranchus ocellatus TaxID=259542 RepID=A0AAV4E005_9GAST|nr:multiple epidermal growth factor-like domains 10 [Plakobranchus ocellatus]
MVHHALVQGDRYQLSNIYETNYDKYDRSVSLAAGDGAYKNPLPNNDETVSPDEPNASQKKNAGAGRRKELLTKTVKIQASEMGVRQIIMLSLCFSSSCLAQQCTQVGSFGDRCQFQCHCAANTACDLSNGACSGGCDPQWFGPACQYDVSEVTVNGGSGSDLPWLTDNDDTTCNNGNVQSITVRLNTPHPLSWVRIVVRNAAYLKRFQLSYQADGSQASTPCVDPRSAKVNDVTLDISCPTSGVVSQVMLSGATVLELCSLYISRGRNVAFNEATQQSSTFYGFILWYASNAVDENPAIEGTSASSEATCSHTISDRTGLAWWRVTFSNDVDINRFVIYNRRDCCENRLINFTLQAYSSSGTNPVYIYTEPGGPAQLVYTVVPSPPIGFSVNSVQLDVSKNTDKQNILTLCDVYVFGEVVCPAGKFDRQCERDCNCADQTEACFVSTGGCPSGCAAGYTGEDCYTYYETSLSDQPRLCGEEAFGTSNLHTDADLISSTTSKRKDGADTFKNGVIKKAKQTLAVREESSSTRTCEDGKYGVGCNESCSSNCAQSTNICNPVNGACNGGCGSTPGYRPPLCKEQCFPGTYGIECAQNCSDHCAGQNDICDTLFGVCEFGCDPGYQSVQCDIQCDPGKYGQDCKETCSDHCAGESKSCNHVSGTCDLGCEDRFYGPLCKDECPKGKYGRDCDKTCSVHCAGPSNTCDWTDGSCDFGCDPGYLPPMCAEVCPRGRYGAGCNETCSEHCAGVLNNCDHRDGTCLLGCEEGYGLPKCDTGNKFLQDLRRRTATNHSQSPSSDEEVKGDAQNLPLPPLPGPPVRSIIDKTHENKDHMSTQGNQNQRPYHTLQHPENDGDGDHVYERTDDPYERPLSLVGDCGAYENPLSIGVTPGSLEKSNNQIKDDGAGQDKTRAHNYQNLESVSTM